MGPRRMIAAWGLAALMGCGEDASTGPVGPEPSPDPDVTAPAVVLTLPAPDAELHGTVELRAHATDNVRIAGVQFLVDGEPYGDEIRTHPYRLLFDSRRVGDGSHTLSVRARDAAGHTAESAPITVVVYNDPGVVELTITAPEGFEDADGFSLFLDRDGSRVFDVPGAGTFTIPDVPAGTRRLTLAGLPPFCTADEQTVKVRSTAPASAVMTVGCLADAADGWLLVSRGGQSLSLIALSLRTGRETVLVPDVMGLGAVSPDGSRLAFIDDGTLMIGDLDAFAPVAVASIPGAWEVSWSPDGSALVAAGDRGGVRDLFIVNADGTGLRPVFDTPGSRRRPVWSATGRIAFEAASAGPMGDLTTIWSADSDGGNAAQLTYGIYDEWPAWSPDASRLAFTRYTVTSTAISVQVTIANADGTGAEPVTGAEAVGYPVWSPDGRWIAYSATAAVQATQLGGTPTMLLSEWGGEVLGWVAGGRFD